MQCCAALVGRCEKSAAKLLAAFSRTVALEFDVRRAARKSALSPREIAQTSSPSAAAVDHDGRKFSGTPPPVRAPVRKPYASRWRPREDGGSGRLASRATSSGSRWKSSLHNTLDVTRRPPSHFPFAACITRSRCVKSSLPIRARATGALEPYGRAHRAITDLPNARRCTLWELERAPR